MVYYDIVYLDAKDKCLHSFLFSTLTECDKDEPLFITQKQYPATWSEVFACPVVGKRLEYLKSLGRCK